MKPVVKLSSSGYIVATYNSAAQAARENYVEKSAISRYCLGKNKKNKTADGWIYRYVSEVTT